MRSFRRAVRKNPRQRKVIEEALRRLAANPFDPHLATHKLKGKLVGTWACSTDYDMRILFEFLKSGSDRLDEILLLELGTHDEVY